MVALSGADVAPLGAGACASGVEAGCCAASVVASRHMAPPRSDFAVVIIRLQRISSCRAADSGFTFDYRWQMAMARGRLLRGYSFASYRDGGDWWPTRRVAARCESRAHPN